MAGLGLAEALLVTREEAEEHEGPAGRGRGVPGVDVAKAHHEVKRLVHAAVETLNQRERYIVEHRLLAEPEERMTLEDIGAEFGVSRERVRQLETEIKQKLQRRLARPWRESLKELIVPEDAA